MVYHDEESAVPAGYLHVSHPLPRILFPLALIHALCGCTGQGSGSGAAASIQTNGQPGQAQGTGAAGGKAGATDAAGNRPSDGDVVIPSYVVEPMQIEPGSTKKVFRVFFNPKAITVAANQPASAPTGLDAHLGELLPTELASMDHNDTSCHPTNSSSNLTLPVNGDGSVSTAEYRPGTQQEMVVATIEKSGQPPALCANSQGSNFSVRLLKGLSQKASLTALSPPRTIVFRGTAGLAQSADGSPVHLTVAVLSADIEEARKSMPATACRKFTARDVLATDLTDNDGSLPGLEAELPNKVRGLALYLAVDPDNAPDPSKNAKGGKSLGSLGTLCRDSRLSNHLVFFHSWIAKDVSGERQPDGKIRVRIPPGTVAGVAPLPDSVGHLQLFSTATPPPTGGAWACRPFVNHNELADIAVNAEGGGTTEPLVRPKAGEALYVSLVDFTQGSGDALCIDDRGMRSFAPVTIGN